jgi:hypothetical protein
MKLADLLKVAAPLLAADKTPEDLRRAVIAADKKAKDADPEEREAAMDAREAGMDEAEEKADKEKAEDAAAKDRKAARDARKSARDKRAADRKAAKDAETDPEGTDADLSQADPSTAAHGGKSEKGALDSAEVDRRIAAAVAVRDAAHAACREVEPVLGVVTFDSAPAAYRAALDKLGIDHKDMHDSALRTVLQLAKDRAAAATPTGVTMDSGMRAEVTKLIPHYGRLS